MSLFARRHVVSVFAPLGPRVSGTPSRSGGYAGGEGAAEQAQSAAERDFEAAEQARINQELSRLLAQSIMDELAAHDFNERTFVDLDPAAQSLFWPSGGAPPSVAYQQYLIDEMAQQAAAAYSRAQVPGGGGGAGDGGGGSGGGGSGWSPPGGGGTSGGGGSQSGGLWGWLLNLFSSGGSEDGDGGHYQSHWTEEYEQMVLDYLPSDDDEDSGAGVNIAPWSEYPIPRVGFSPVVPMQMSARVLPGTGLGGLAANGLAMRLSSALLRLGERVG